MKPQSLVLVGQSWLGNQCVLSRRILYPILFLTLGIFLRMASSAECGHPTMTQRIVGGQSTHLGKAPWMGSLHYRGRHVCGLSVLSRSWVITAAHCADARDPTLLLVMLGAVNLTGPSDTRVTIGVKSVVLHPRYSGSGSSGDLALMELKTLINFTSNIYPICLPAPYEDFPDGMLCSLTGWGRTAQGVRLPEPFPLQEVELPLVNAPACDDMLRAKYPGIYTSGAIRDDMICAGFANESKDACLGDSGGPLVCQIGHTWLLVGIVSWGIDCAVPGVPGFYTKVSNFTSWITEKCNVTHTLVTETPEKIETSSTVVRTRTSSTMAKTQTSSTTVQSGTSSPTVNPNAVSTTRKTQTSSTTVQSGKYSTMEKNVTSSPTVNPNAFSTTRSNQTFSTLKPKHGTLTQQCTTNGANLRSSITTSLLIISSMIFIVI